jgi:hypothetical protein
MYVPIQACFQSIELGWFRDTGRRI